MTHSDLGPWDRTTYMLKCWPLAVGRAVNLYGTQVPTAALEDLVIDELIDLTERFPEWCDEKGQEPTGALFWTFLSKAVDQRAWKEGARARRILSFEEMTTGDDGEEMYWSRALLAAGDLEKARRPSDVHHRVADRIALFPTRWKLLLALRFHHELSVTEVADIVGSTRVATQQLLRVICNRVREIARSEVIDTPDDTPQPRTLPWEVPYTAHRWAWLNTRHPDLYTWLGHVQHDYTADVSYLLDMLMTANGVAVLHGARGSERPEKYAPCGTESAYQRHKRTGDDIDAECESAHAGYLVEKRARVREIDAARSRGDEVTLLRRGPRAA